jgi:chromosome partitioning protein
MATTIVFANYKGGCGKTTSTANTGAALAALGRRVLLVDADPQANLSEAFGVPADLEGPRLEDVLETGDALPEWEVALDERAARNGGLLSLVPCTSRLEPAVTALVGDAGGATLLRDLLASLDESYDAVLLDTPPGLGPLSSMAMLAARWVVVPARPADFDVAGALKLADLVRTELSELNPSLELLGVLMTQVDRRWTIAADTRAALAAADVHQLTIDVPFMVRTGAAPRHGLPTVLLEPDSKLALAYHRLAKELDAVLLGRQEQA